MDLGEGDRDARTSDTGTRPGFAHPRLLSLAVGGLLAAPPIVVTAFKIARMDDAEWGDPFVAIFSVVFLLVLHGLGPLLVSQGILMLLDRDRYELKFQQGLQRIAYGSAWITSFVSRHMIGLVIGSGVRGIILGLVLCVISNGIAFS